MNARKYRPCIEDPKTGRVNRPVAGPMSREQAEEYLKKHYRRQWLKCEAMPQLEPIR